VHYEERRKLLQTLSRLLNIDMVWLERDSNWTATLKME
jgi:hypothetical protein